MFLRSKFEIEQLFCSQEDSERDIIWESVTDVRYFLCELDCRENINQAIL